jgi:hypothetical protein
MMKHLLLIIYKAAGNGTCDDAERKRFTSANKESGSGVLVTGCVHGLPCKQKVHCIYVKVKGKVVSVLPLSTTP